MFGLRYMPVIIAENKRQPETNDANECDTGDNKKTDGEVILSTAIYKENQV